MARLPCSLTEVAIILWFCGSNWGTSKGQGGVSARAGQLFVFQSDTYGPISHVASMALCHASGQQKFVSSLVLWTISLKGEGSSPSERTKERSDSVRPWKSTRSKHQTWLESLKSSPTSQDLCASMSDFWGSGATFEWQNLCDFTCSCWLATSWHHSEWCGKPGKPRSLFFFCLKKQTKW